MILCLAASIKKITIPTLVLLPAIASISMGRVGPTARLGAKPLFPPQSSAGENLRGAGWEYPSQERVTSLIVPFLLLLALLKGKENKRGLVA